LIKLQKKLLCKHILVASWHVWKFGRVKCKDSNSRQLLGDGVLPWHRASAYDRLFQQHNNLMSHWLCVPSSVCVEKTALTLQSEALSSPSFVFLD